MKIFAHYHPPDVITSTLSQYLCTTSLNSLIICVVFRMVSTAFSPLEFPCFCEPTISVLFTVSTIEFFLILAFNLSAVIANGEYSQLRKSAANVFIVDICITDFLYGISVLINFVVSIDCPDSDLESSGPHCHQCDARISLADWLRKSNCNFGPLEVQAVRNKGHSFGFVRCYMVDYISNYCYICNLSESVHGQRSVLTLDWMLAPRYGIMPTSFVTVITYIIVYLVTFITMIRHCRRKDGTHTDHKKLTLQGDLPNCGTPVVILGAFPDHLSIHEAPNFHDFRCPFSCLHNSSTSDECLCILLASEGLQRFIPEVARNVICKLRS